ncbi:extracellular solute-binding protein [Paenibacillus thermotolerans]|uniref:extracellular solute-binding protein n=1 Tax=Paenibacillus thermotolerans TaxID=3027807 RepID=UPI002367D734|nr:MULTISPECIES: extracellular solute-binding protein [unclassified Paenibacillus]
MRFLKQASTMLATAMLAGFVAGCAGSAANNAAEPASSDPKEAPAAAAEPAKFSYLRPVWGPATYQKGGPYEKELFKQGNVEIEAQIIPVKEYNPKVNAILASGDLPDVLWGSGPTNSVFLEAQQQGAFLKINDYLDKYPAIKEALPQYLWDMVTDENGDIYFIPNPVSPYVPFMLMYRQDWFEKLNIPEPKTLEELVAALEVIKNSDPDGNGSNDTIPLSVGTRWYLKELATSFGTSHDGWEPSPEDPNKLIPQFANDKWINFNVWLQDLSKQGLLDPDFGVVQDHQKVREKFLSGKTAVFPNNYSDYLTLLGDMRKMNPDAKIGLMSPLAGFNGEEGGIRTIVPIDRGIYISSKAKDPEGIFRFLNWQLTEGYDLRRYGIEGKTYTVSADGQKEDILDADRDPAYQKPQIEPFLTITPYNEAMQNWDLIKNGFELNEFGDKFEPYKQKFDEYVQVQYPDYRDRTIVSPFEMKEGTKLYEDIMKSTVEGLAINHKLTKQDWMNQLKKWEEAGGAKLIEEVNELQTDKSKPMFE